jgi:hypothetical protein
MLMPKLFHDKFPVKIPFKIQFRQSINCKLTFSAFAFDKSNTHSQREMSLAPKTDAPDAPGSVTSRSAFNYSAYKTHIMKFNFIISTTKIKINNLNLPEIEHLNYHNPNHVIGNLDKPYENDLEYVHTKSEKIRLNGWPPPNMHVKIENHVTTEFNFFYTYIFNHKFNFKTFLFLLRMFTREYLMMCLMSLFHSNRQR